MASRKTPRAVELLERHARPKEKEIAKGLLWRAKAIEQAVKRLAPAVKQGFATGQLPPELTEAIEDIERTYIAKWLAPMWRECFLNAKKDIATEVARASGKKAWGESWDVDFPELSQAAADFIARQTGVRVTNISATVRAAWQRELAQIIGEHVIEKPSSPATTAREVYGHLNYIISSILKRYVDAKGKRYFRLQNLIGVLECAKMEMNRRIVGIYEDEAIEKNGDI